MIDNLRNQFAASFLGLARRLATDQGWARLSDAVGAPNMRAGLWRLRDRGFRPQIVVDGGACVGDWTLLFHSVFPDAKILMVEPQAPHFDVLSALAARRATHRKVVSTLLGPPGMNSAPFVVLDDASGGTGSSVLSEISDVPRHVVETPVTTLDKLVLERGFGFPDFIKLDVQGFEIEVLKGAAEALKRADFVLLEVGVRNYNKGAPLLHEVLQWMHGQGFNMYELFDLSRRSDILVQLDLLFARIGSKAIPADPND